MSFILSFFLNFLESVHSEQEQEQYPVFNLSTVSPSALLCNINQQEINCGKLLTKTFRLEQ